jgi:superfamily II DNA or RNA helicase
VPSGWDGYIQFITSGGRFLTGLLPLVSRLLEEMGEEASIKYPDQPPDAQKGAKFELNGVTLRDYQVEAVKTALGARRGILEMATNAGKTEVAISIMANLVKYGQILWLTHSLTLNEQTISRILGRVGLRVSKCRMGNADLSGEIVVSNVQTLNSVLKKDRGPLSVWLGDIASVILDECHLGSAASWVNILTRCESAQFRFGLSGTPYTDDKVRNRELVGITGETIYKVGNQYLINKDVSCVPIVMSIPFSHKEYLSYAVAIDKGIDHNNNRNSLIINTLSRLENGRPGLVLVQHISQGKELLRIAKSMKKNAVFVRGANTLSERSQAIKCLRENTLDFVIATTIFDLGVDIPELSWLFLASPTKSTVRILQRIGRVLRKADGKDEAMVYYVDDDGDYFLRSAAKKMHSVIKKEGFEIV